MKNNMENNKKQQTAFSILDVVQQVEKAILDVFVEKEIDLDDAIKILGLAAGELIDTCPNEKKLSEYRRFQKMLCFGSNFRQNRRNIGIME